MTTTFNVSAKSTRDVAPTHGVVRVFISTKSDNKRSAYENTARIHNGVAEEVRVNAAVTDRVINAPTSFSRREWVDESTVTRYITSSVILVEFENLEALSEFIAEWSDNANIEVSVSWKIDEATRRAIESELRQEAVQRSREIASDYASGAGLNPNSLLLRSVTDDSAVPAVATFGAAPRSAKAAAAPVMQIEPDEIVLSASISAVYYVD